MTDRLHLLPCPFLKREFESLLKKAQFSEVTFNGDQEENTFSSEKLVTFSDNLQSLRFGCAENIINIKKILQDHHECVDLVLGTTQIEQLKSKGHQILLPSMVTHLNHALEGGLSKSHFAHLKNILVLDTNINPLLNVEIQKLQNLLAVSVTQLPVTLDYLEQKLEMHLEIWHQYQNMALINENLFYAQKEKANYAIILDFIGRIQRLDTEKKVIDDLLDLVVMISGSTEAHFIDSQQNRYSFSSPLDDNLLQSFLLWIDTLPPPESKWTHYPMKYRDERLGTLFIHSEDQNKIAIIGTLLLALMNFTGLALDKLRNMNQLANQKELEAIHAMVATYNHEINNPLSIAIGYLNIMDKKKDFKYLPEVKTALDKIDEIVRKISEITNKSLNFANYSKDSQRLKID